MEQKGRTALVFRIEGMLKRRTKNASDRRSTWERIPAGKWISSVKPEMPTPEAARDCLRLRFETVLYWFPRAAEHPEEDIENVHQLRVSLRRVATNLGAFRKLLKRKAYRSLRESFRTIMKGAGAARDADVLLARFRLAEREPKPGVEQVVARLVEERKAAQETILDAYHALPPKRLRRQFDKATAPLREKTKRAGRLEARFGLFACHLLIPFGRSFDTAFHEIGDDIAQLHAFRVAGKKLRYALEIAAPAFEKTARRDVYRTLVSLQDYLGLLNDHHQMILRFEQWPGPQGVIEGMLASERMIVDDLQGLFSQWWPKRKHERFMQSLESLIHSRNGG